MPILAETTLQRTSLREQALALLREALITGRIADGEVYSAKALAAELGVSNGPIREAMLALVDDGLMEAVPIRAFGPCRSPRPTWPKSMRCGCCSKSPPSPGWPKVTCQATALLGSPTL